MAPAVRAEAGSLTARGERTRRRLVAAGEDVFGLRGYHDASIAEITQTASVAQGTFYLYFDGKRDMMRAVVEERGHELRATLARATADVVGRVAKAPGPAVDGRRAIGTGHHVGAQPPTVGVLIRIDQIDLVGVVGQQAAHGHDDSQSGRTPTVRVVLSGQRSPLTQAAA